jgi:hypothetical protein
MSQKCLRHRYLCDAMWCYVNLAGIEPALLLKNEMGPPMELRGGSIPVLYGVGGEAEARTRKISTLICTEKCRTCRVEENHYAVPPQEASIVEEAWISAAGIQDATFGVAGGSFGEEGYSSSYVRYRARGRRSGLRRCAAAARRTPAHGFAGCRSRRIYCSN